MGVPRGGGAIGHWQARCGGAGVRGRGFRVLRSAAAELSCWAVLCFTAGELSSAPRVEHPPTHPPHHTTPHHTTPPPITLHTIPLHPQGDTIKLVDDLGALKPTLFIGVPRIFDRIYSAVTGTVNKAGA